MKRRLTVFLIGAVSVAACNSARDRNNPAKHEEFSANHFSHTCPTTAGSVGVLSFDDLSTDATTGDQSGLQFEFTDTGATTVGTVREAAGELGGRTPLTDLVIGADDSLSFNDVTGRDTARFRGRFSCDSIWGRWAPYPTVIDEHKVFTRTQALIP